MTMKAYESISLRAQPHTEWKPDSGWRPCFRRPI